MGKEGGKEKGTDEGKEYLDRKDKGTLCLRTAIFSVEIGERAFRHERSRGRIEGLIKYRYFQKKYFQISINCILHFQNLYICV